MAVLARFLDDCWEPGSAVATLRTLAGRADEEARALCLRVGADGLDGARVTTADSGGDSDEAAGAAAYLWVLWSDSPPTRAELAALYDEFRDAAGDSEP
jgi:hypothetical protein